MKLTLAILNPFGEKGLDTKPQALKNRTRIFLISRHLRN